MSYTLDINGVKTVENPSEEDIQKAVLSLDVKQNDAFLILSKHATTFIQVWTNKQGIFGVEYRTAQNRQLYRSKQFLNTKEVLEMLFSYLNGTQEWKEGKIWEKIDKGTEEVARSYVAPNNKIVIHSLLFIIITVVTLSVLRWYSIVGNPLAYKTFKILVPLMFFLAATFIPAYALEAGVFSDQPNRNFNKMHFQLYAICGALIWIVGFLIIKYYPSTTIFFQKAGLILTAFFLFWALRKGFRTGYLPTRGGRISRHELPVLFTLGIFLYFLMLVGIMIFVFVRK